MKSNDPNLAPFFNRGGKLLMWHGWADPQVPPQLSTIYYANVLKTVGPSAEQSIALFMMPGVYHCAGGPGPDNFDRMGAIAAWVERGHKPTRLTASRLSTGVVDRTRPLCPYGQVAVYSGNGQHRRRRELRVPGAGAAPVDRPPLIRRARPATSSGPPAARAPAGAWGWPRPGATCVA